MDGGAGGRRGEGELVEVDQDQRAGLRGFSLAGGYGAFSVSQSNAAAVIRYIQNQEEHHRKTTFPRGIPEFLAAAWSRLRRAVRVGLRAALIAPGWIGGEPPPCRQRRFPSRERPPYPREESLPSRYGHRTLGNGGCPPGYGPHSRWNDGRGLGSHRCTVGRVAPLLGGMAVPVGTAAAIPGAAAVPAGRGGVPAGGSRRSRGNGGSPLGDGRHTRRYSRRSLQSVHRHGDNCCRGRLERSEHPLRDRGTLARCGRSGRRILPALPDIDCSHRHLGNFGHDRGPSGRNFG